MCSQAYLLDPLVWRSSSCARPRTPSPLWWKAEFWEWSYVTAALREAALLPGWDASPSARSRNPQDRRGVSLNTVRFSFPESSFFWLIILKAWICTILLKSFRCLCVLAYETVQRISPPCLHVMHRAWISSDFRVFASTEWWSTWCLCCWDICPAPLILFSGFETRTTCYNMQTQSFWDAELSQKTAVHMSATQMWKHSWKAYGFPSPFPISIFSWFSQKFLSHLWSFVLFSFLVIVFV